jgi:AcrR family transcriptional regulator
MAKTSSPEAKLADAALRLLSRKAWRDISLGEVAKAAKLPMTALTDVARTKSVLVGLVLRRFGERTAKAYRPDRDAASGRDRLFDVGMAWFDAIAPDRRAVRSLYDGLKSDPLALLSLRNDFAATAEWLMTLAEADKGPALPLRALAFAAVLGRAIPVWLDDDSNLTKTMARLDGDLRRGESWLGKL